LIARYVLPHAEQWMAMMSVKQLNHLFGGLCWTVDVFGPWRQGWTS